MMGSEAWNIPPVPILLLEKGTIEFKRKIEMYYSGPTPK